MFGTRTASFASVSESIMLQQSQINFAALVCIVLAASVCMPAQTSHAKELKAGTIVGTVIDVNNDPVPGATVILKNPDSDQQTVVTGENGSFEFNQLRPGIVYRIDVSASGFAAWISPTITLEAGQYKILTGVQLRIETERTTVNVHYDPVEIATEQIKIEEQQRVFGIIPNYYVSYESSPAPLTAKMKFGLALRVSADPVTVAGVLFVASARQAADSPNYGQGWDAYGKRAGAVAADGFSDILIGGAILPSLLHQDPRYFYQGTGTTGSRIRHAMLSPFITRNDNGKWGPNYSSLGGDLGSSALDNLYYPRSNRGVGLVLGQFALSTAERIGASLAQEFIVGKLTHRGGHVN